LDQPEQRSILVLGHPRCGTGYMAKLLQSFGLDVGHEKIGKDGVSYWGFAVFDDNWAKTPRGPSATYSSPWSGKKVYVRNDFDFKNVIHAVRNPIDALPSILYQENIVKNSLDFRWKHVTNHFSGKISGDANYTDLEKAILTLIYWNVLIIYQKRDLVVMVESCEDRVRDFLIQKGLIEDKKYCIFKDKRYNNKSNRDVITQADYAKVRESVMAELNYWSCVIGYGDIEPQIKEI